MEISLLKNQEFLKMIFILDLKLRNLIFDHN